MAAGLFVAVTAAPALDEGKLLPLLVAEAGKRVCVELGREVCVAVFAPEEPLAELGFAKELSITQPPLLQR